MPASGSTKPFQDVHFGLRLLARNPGVTLLATIALGIGLNTAIFSVLNAALFQSMPVHHPEQLVMLTDPNASLVLGGLLAGERSLLSYAEFTQLHARTTGVSGLCASQMQLQPWQVRVAGQPPEQIHGRLISENYFSVLSVKPPLGRLLTQHDAPVSESLPCRHQLRLLAAPVCRQHRCYRYRHSPPAHHVRGDRRYC